MFLPFLSCVNTQVPWEEQLRLEGWVVSFFAFHQSQKHFRDYISAFKTML